MLQKTIDFILIVFSEANKNDYRNTHTANIDLPIQSNN